MKRKIVSILFVLTLAIPVAGCSKEGKIDNMAVEPIWEHTENAVRGNDEEEFVMEGASYIRLADEEITIDGDSATTNVKEAVYVANDIVYYEEGKDFTYGEGKKGEEHSKEEANSHTVVHITEPGTYVLSGKLSQGQIAVDLGEEAEDDPEAVVTLVLNNVDITCSVAPAVIFYNVYECSSNDKDEAVKDVDTSSAGARVLIPDDTNNMVTGSYVAKIYKSVELNEEGTKVVDSKKLHKYDGAFYSKMSMNIDGGKKNTGVLNIFAENEGLDTELHLTLNGGTVNIVSGNDGINTNEDKVSVTTVNGGFLNIRVDGSTGEGDGIDSNGWLVINDGVVIASACATSMDAGVDSDKGIHINGGTVIAGGNMLDHISESKQNYVVFTFNERVEAGSEITLKKGEENIFSSLPNEFTYLIISYPKLTEGTYTLWKGEEQLSVMEVSGMGGMIPGGFGGGQPPEGFEPEEMPEGFGEGQPPERIEPGEMPEGFGGGQPPERFESGRMPGGVRGQNGFGQVSMEDAVTEFEIKNGGNQFMVLSARKDS